jgi:RHS repeat-associated protein
MAVSVLSYPCWCLYCAPPLNRLACFVAAKHGLRKTCEFSGTLRECGKYLAERNAAWDGVWVLYAVGSPAVRLGYTYNISGEMTQSAFHDWDGSAWTERSERRREYDRLGRLAKVLENGQEVATYTRSAMGRLAKTTLFDRGAVVMERTKVRDVLGRPLERSYLSGGQPLYQEVTTYGTSAARAASKTHGWKVNGATTTHTTQYAYDELSRLVSATGDLGGSYEFDVAGRLTDKQENGKHLRFGYMPTAYRVNWIDTAGDRPYYLHNYDVSGNLVHDHRTKSEFTIGAHSLPVEVAVAPTDGVGWQVSMVYDEAGARAWRTVKNTATNEERTEAIVPGVGSYVKENNGEWRLLRLDLVEGGYRQNGNGNAVFPVRDAQGNVRGLAEQGTGLVAAYAYTSYGQIKELKEASLADNLRWQGKLWDGEYGLYNFGSRYFDPVTGMWTSPDPAGQFANPYGYGGDPINFVDPNGEWVHIVIGAIVGAVMGTVNGIVQCANSDQSCARTIGAGAVVGAAAGAATAATGGAVGEWATGAVGLATESGTAAAVAGGAAQGAVSGAVGGFVSSTANSAIQRGDDWWKFNRSFGDDAFAALYGGLGGMASGALTAGIMYGLSDAYQWQTHKTVLEYANSTGRLETRGIQYILANEGIESDIGYVTDSNLELGKSNYSYDTNIATISEADITTDGRFSAAKFYHAVVHESNHKPLFSTKGLIQWEVMQTFDGSGYKNMLDTQEKIINRNMMGHKYFHNWPNDLQKFITDKYHSYINKNHPAFYGF